MTFDRELPNKKMVPIFEKTQRYTFRNNSKQHYVDCRILSKNEQETLGQLLASFPHVNQDWPAQFLSLNWNDFPRDLLPIAENAFDKAGNTMLGVACEHGEFVEIVEKLIAIGANLNTPDHQMSKLPLHWAIANKLASKKGNIATQMVKCLLDHGASIYINCYDNMGVIGYARSRRYNQACELIETYLNSIRDKKFKNYIRSTVISLLRNFPIEINEIISESLDANDGRSIACTNRGTYNIALTAKIKFLMSHPHVGKRLTESYENLFHALKMLYAYCHNNKLFKLDDEMIKFMKHSLLLIHFNEYKNIVRLEIGDHISLEPSNITRLYPYSSEPIEGLLDHYILKCILDPVWNFHYKHLRNPPTLNNDHLKDHYTNLANKLVAELNADEQKILQQNPGISLPKQASKNAKMVHGILNAEKKPTKTPCFLLSCLKPYARLTHLNGFQER